MYTQATISIDGYELVLQDIFQCDLPVYRHLWHRSQTSSSVIRDVRACVKFSTHTLSRQECLK